jgi:hypothetical protein
VSDEVKPIIGPDYEPGWYVVNLNDYEVVRGPYEHGETAVAVRRELEYRWPNRRWNLGIVPKKSPRGQSP